MTILGVLARVPVADLDSALPLYQGLSGTDVVHRFRHGPIELAWVGSFLLLCGDEDALSVVSRAATLLIDDMDDVVEQVRRAGGDILEGPAAAPNGRRMIARHGDGNVFEYIELSADD